MSLTPLSNPKGVKFDCEMCGASASIQCPTCRVTYYCTKVTHLEALLLLCCLLYILYTKYVAALYLIIYIYIHISINILFLV